MASLRRDIPALLVRRSHRIQKSMDKKNSEDSEHNYARELTKMGKRRKIKLETTPSIPSKTLFIEPKEEIFDECDLLRFPKAEGYLEVDCDELDLERTLMGGQSFRWVKRNLRESEEPIFTGVILDYALQLWRPSKGEVAFRTLNKESEEVKISDITFMLEDYFQIKHDLKSLYQEWSTNDPHLASCCKQYRGFRILRQDPIENVFSFICATNNNIKRISLMVDKMCKKFGKSLNSSEGKGRDTYYSFPSVERLAQEDVFQSLRYDLGFGYRAKFISETAKQISELSSRSQQTPREFLLSLRKLSYKETCKQLMQFQGIGRKVADCICLMSMDHLNSVPIDCHIYEIVCRHYMPNLRQEHKTLTEAVHDKIGHYFNGLHGSLAGWSTSVLFIAELKHLKLEQKKKPKRE